MNRCGLTMKKRNDYARLKYSRLDLLYKHADYDLIAISRRQLRKTLDSGAHYHLTSRTRLNAPCALLSLCRVRCCVGLLSCAGLWIIWYSHGMVCWGPVTSTLLVR